MKLSDKMKLSKKVLGKVLYFFDIIINFLVTFLNLLLIMNSNK